MEEKLLNSASSSSSSSSSTLLLGRLADISGALRTFVVALSGHLALSGQRWRLADVFWWRLADAVALCGHKWRLADIKQILALSELSDVMALFSVFSIFARFPIIQPKRFMLCMLTHTLIFYLMRVVLS